MNMKYQVLLVLSLTFIVGCSDKDARSSIQRLATEVQQLNARTAALETTKVGYGEEKFKLENVTYQFSQDAFNPVLNGRAKVIAVNEEALPVLARLEVSYRVFSSDKALLSQGLVPVSLINGRGELNFQVSIPFMITDSDSVSIQLMPHQWLPVFPARSAP